MIRLSKIIPLIILLISALSLHSHSYIISTSILWGLFLLIIVLFVINKYKLTTKTERTPFFWVTLYVFWIMYSTIIGLFVAELYIDYKALYVNVLGLLIVLATYISLNPTILQNTLRTYVLFIIPLFIFYIPFLDTLAANGYIIYTLSLILLFTPIIPKRWRIIIVLVSIFLLSINLTARAVFLKISIALVLSLAYYFKFIINKKALNKIMLLLYFTPFIFLILAITTPFNILKIQEQYDLEITVQEKNLEGDYTENNIFTDSRSWILEQAINTAKKNNSWWFGRTPCRGIETKFFRSTTFDLTGRYERVTNEVGIVNLFTWMGLIGVFLYFMVLYKASYLAINKSNNYWAKILGLYIAFRWIVFWMEDIQNFTLNHFVLMLMIGLAYSKWFRLMSNKEVEYWIRGIFIKKYRV